MDLNTWIETEYKTISLLAKNYTKTEYKTLVSYYYMYLYTNWPKLDVMCHTDKMKYTNKWFSNNAKWKGDGRKHSGSKFNQDKTINNLPEVYDFEIGEDSCKYIEISAENVSDDIKGWLNDIEHTFCDAGDKIIKVRALYISKYFETTDRVLYDLYFTQLLSGRQIAKKLNIPHSSVHVMLRDLKNKIRTLCGVTSSVV